VLHRNNVRAVGAGIALALVSGCGAGTTPQASASGFDSLASARATSFIESARQTDALAYVVDTSGVDVYSYPGFSKLQTLSGSSGASSECADSAGNVWVVLAGGVLLKYAHGGTQPIATLSDSEGFPVSCAVSPSGTLAVANILSKSYGPGNIVLYSHAKGAGKVVPGSEKVYFLGYDVHDNLFGDGISSLYQFKLFELTSGSKSIKSIAINGAPIAFPGNVQYAGSALNVIDQDTSINYELRVKGRSATVIGETPLTGAGDCVGTYIYRTKLLCPDAGNSDLKLYAYPKGGSPIEDEPVAGATEVVISVDSK
jgi:hypothetical protein